MKIINLTKGSETTVNDSNCSLLSKFKWFTAMKNSYGKPYFYAARNINCNNTIGV